MDHRALPLHEMPTVWRRPPGQAGGEVRSGRDDRRVDRSLPCDLSRPNAEVGAIHPKAVPVSWRRPKSARPGWRRHGSRRERCSGRWWMDRFRW